MIKAEELIIGNWVLDGTKYAQVTLITCDGIIETTVNKKSNIELLEPIPITPEILEENGFYWGYPVDVEDMASNVFGELPIEMPNKSWVWDEGAGVISITFPNDSDGGEISCENGYCYFSFVFDGIIYVHQLQHALKLCGINKNIEL